ncbi:MAG TPA: choice-of-anchor X domain-containing protein, partial [candidate division Zixibacteria bacterium]|nr:choice-of-anchor X domain-containing protein [candidate division Zixibacteria bacterium]
MNRHLRISSLLASSVVILSVLFVVLLGSKAQADTTLATESRQIPGKASSSTDPLTIDTSRSALPGVTRNAGEIIGLRFDPDPPLAGQELAILVAVRNSGSEPWDSQQLDLAVDLTNEAGETFTAYGADAALVEFVQPGQEATVSASLLLPYEQTGSFSVAATLRHQGQVVARHDSATADLTAQRTMPLVADGPESADRLLTGVSFWYPLPEDLRRAIAEGLETTALDKLPGQHYAITSDRIEGEWAMLSVAVLEGPNCGGDAFVGSGDCGAPMLAHRQDGTWQAALSGSETYAQLLAAAPQTFLDPAAKPLLDPLNQDAQALLAAQSLSVLNYKFPWPAGAWEYWNEWHQVSGGRGAMDFGIADLEPRVLAAADGAILGICRGKLSANVNIQHDDGQIYTYYHFDVNKLEAATLQGSRVQQGQVLGRLIPGSWTVAEDYNPLTKRSCGYADQSAANAHLHWEMPTTVTATVDGWSIRYPSINWQKDGQTVTPGYGSLHVIASTNEPIISNYGHAVDLVFAMDTSGSMDDEFESLCTKIDQIVAELSSRGIQLNYRILGIASVRSCATNTVTNLIPGGVSNHIEDWGPATEDLAKFYDWRPGHARLVVPMGDEGPQDGEPCNDPGADRDAVSAAIEAAQSNYVLVSPVLGTIYYQGSVECVTGLAQDLADGTSGKLFTSADSADKLATGLINIVGKAVVPDPYGEREPAELPSLEEVEASNNLFEADEDEVAQWFHEHIDDLQAFQELYHQSTNRRTRTINLPISRFYGEVNPDNNQLDNPDLIQDAQLVVCAWDIDPLEDVTIQINGQDALTLEGDPGTDREFYCRSYPLTDKLDLLRFPVSEGLSSDPIRNDALGEPVRPLAADNQFTITYSEKYKALVYSLRLIIKGVRPVVLVPGFGADANTYEWGDIKNDLIANGVSVVRPCHFQWLFEYVAFPPRWKWEVYDTGRYDGDEIEVNEYLNPRCFEAARPKPLILVELRSDIHDLGTLTRNARALRWTIDEVKTRYGVSKVNLVGHSKGGLFSRAYVDSDGGYQGDVENLISISSPQHGSFMMDIAAKNVTLPADWAETINCENSPLCNWTPEKMQEWSQKTFASMFSFKVNDTTGYEITTRGVDDRFGVDDQGNSVSPQTGVDYYAIVATAGTVSDATSLDPARNDMGQSVDYFANSLNAYDISYRLNYYQGDLDSRYQAMAGESDITIATASQQIGNLPNYGAFVDQCVVVRANHDESRRFQATANVILGILGLSEIVAPPCTVLANGDAFSVRDPLQSLSGDVSESATAQVLTYQGVITYGQHIDTPFAVDGTHLEMTGFWQGDAGISLTLIDPDGHLIDPASALADPGMDYYQDLLPVDAAGAAGYIITDTVTGLWIARLEAPASGPAVEPMSWSLIASQQSKIELGLSTVPISTTLGMTVTVLAEPVSGTLPITNVVISGTISGWGGITQTLAFADDGQHDDALAGDGIYGAFFYPTAPGEQWIQATTSDALPGGTPYERQADAKVMIYPDSARLTGLYNDVSIDSDGDGLFDNLDIGVEIALKKGGDFSLLGALSTQGGQLLGAVTQVVTSTVATTTWATLTFPAGLIVDAPADGPYHLSLAQIFDLESSLPADQQTAVYTTGQAYQRSDFFGQEVRVVGKPLETALDSNGNALYEQLTFDVPLLLRHPGSYTVTAWLDVTSDYG